MDHPSHGCGLSQTGVSESMFTYTSTQKPDSHSATTNMSCSSTTFPSAVQKGRTHKILPQIRNEGYYQSREHSTGVPRFVPPKLREMSRLKTRRVTKIFMLFLLGTVPRKLVKTTVASAGAVYRPPGKNAHHLASFSVTSREVP